MTTKMTRADRQAIDQAGSPSDIRKRIGTYARAQTRLANQMKTLVERYPNQWVAIDGGNVICSGRSLAQVLANCERKGVPGGAIAVRYMDTKKRAMVL